MRNYFIFDGQDSRNYGVYISGHGTFDSPVREINQISVPGRNGDLIGRGSRLQNKDLTYPAFIYSDFKNKIASLRSMLLSRPGYCRLSDTYHTDEFRMAVFRGALTVETTERNDAGQFDIVFLCKPQRFLTSGETVQTFTSNGTITNPTLFNAQPLIRVYGTGTLTIGNGTIAISAADEYTDIDTEMMRAYKGATPRDSYVTTSGIDYPVLTPGSNTVSKTSGISKVEITPRWWRV